MLLLKLLNLGNIHIKKIWTKKVLKAPETKRSNVANL